jgi:hypothetical protein
MCLDCGDIFNLISVGKICSCGNTHGVYIDDINAEISGNCKAIGFSNIKFELAYTMQDLEDEAQNGANSCLPGVEFTAFFIPETAKSVKRIDKL